MTYYLLFFIIFSCACKVGNLYIVWVWLCVIYIILSAAQRIATKVILTWTWTLRHTLCLPSALYNENRDSSVKRTPLQRARMWAFSYSSRLRRRTAVRSRPWWGWRACRWASLRRFLTVCAEILWLCKPIVAAAVRVAGLNHTWRWRCWMWRSWAGVVTCGLRLWGRLNVLPNSLKCLWRRLMVEKWIFNSRATALVDIPAVKMPIAHSLKTCDICGIVLCDKTAHFRVAYYCGQPKAHLCNNHAV